MTKKELHEIEQKEKRLRSFTNRVNALLGHVAARTPTSKIVEAFESGKDADAFAADIARLEPVGAALHELKSDAVKAASEEAKQFIEKVRKELEEAGWDVNVAAPYPAYNDYHNYKVKVEKHNLYLRLTESVDADKYKSYRRGEPRIVKMSDKGCEWYINHREVAAALYYDAFIVKMVNKIGDCDTVKVSGNHVWSESTLTVNKGDIVEYWKTQQIYNCSKFGVYFPQWPSRKVKG